MLGPDDPTVTCGAPVDINLQLRLQLQHAGGEREPSSAGLPGASDADDRQPLDMDRDAVVDDTPARIVGRGGGKGSMVVYGPTTTLEALTQFADDVYFLSRGQVHRWRVIDQVVSRGMTPARRREIMRALGVENLIPHIAPEDQQVSP